MVFCNKDNLKNTELMDDSHNPYFSRWFSAIRAGEDYVWKSE